MGQFHAEQRSQFCQMPVKGEFMSHQTAKKDFQDWKNKKSVNLPRQEAIEAHCYECNGGQDIYCGGGTSCILYAYSQYNKESQG